MQLNHFFLWSSTNTISLKLAWTHKYTLFLFYPWPHGFWKLETECFCKIRWKRCFVVTWIYCHFSTVLDVVPRGFSKRCRYYALCMNDTRVRCACEIRQLYLCKIIEIRCKFFQRENKVCVLIIVFFFIHLYKHFTIICSLSI